MNLRKNVVIVTLAALVTGAAVLVYAPNGLALTSEPLPDPHAENEQSGDGPNVLYDATKLPESVQRILRKIIIAAQTGDIEAMRPVIESAELKPMFAATDVDDPIAYWKAQSVDGSGRDVLASMLNILGSGFVLSGEGHDAKYVWPYLTEADLTKLTPAQQVELYRLVPPKQAKAMLEKGKYSGYRLGISPGGIWHYFMK